MNGWKTEESVIEKLRDAIAPRTEAVLVVVDPFWENPGDPFTKELARIPVSREELDRWLEQRRVTP